jgi:hypothetical protein
MKIPTLPFTVTDRAGVPRAVHLGETGQATWRTFMIGDVRPRLRILRWMCDKSLVRSRTGAICPRVRTRYRTSSPADIQAAAGNELPGLRSGRCDVSLLDENACQTLHR